MSSLRAWCLRFTGLFAKEQKDRELAEELDAHLQMHIAENIRTGMSPAEARRDALMMLGGVEQTKENYRRRRGLPLIESLLQDLRFGFRMLWKAPGFTIIAVLTIALGIGANTAIFSVLQSIVLAPLPYLQPDRLVIVWQNNPRFPRVAISYPNFLDWQRSAHSFQQMAAFAPWQYDLASPGTPEHLDGEEISWGFFNTLGTKLTLGREFSPQEDLHGGAPVAIISNRLWRNRFGGSPEVLGRAVTLNGVNCRVIGVTPPNFRFEGDPDVYTSLGQGALLAVNDRASHWITAVARLQTGTSISEAQTEMSTIQSGLDQLYPEPDRDLGIVIVPFKQQIIGESVGTILLLSGAAGLVLLIACANLANLLLARSATRTREFGIRLALGANRVRLIRQLLIESSLLSFAGGVIGVALAAIAVRVILAVAPVSIPRRQEVGVSVPVLLFAFAVTVAAGILFGLLPAVKHSKSDLQGALREGGRTSASDRHRVQNVLVIVQTALALVLLVGSGLLFRTIRQLWDVDPGFDPNNAITFKVGFSPTVTKTPASTRNAYQQLIDRIRGVPGVEAADFTDHVPLTGEGGTIPFWIGAEKPASIQAAARMVVFLTGPDYLRTMRIPLLRGRFLTPEDTLKSPCVFAIDSVFAREHFQGRDPIGQQISYGFSPAGPCEIVGIVGHVRDLQLNEATSWSQVYFALTQDPDGWVPVNYPSATVVLRTQLDAAAIIPSIKATVYESEGNQPVYKVRTMQEIVSESMGPQRFPMTLLGAFSFLALILASIGIYGVISYSVTQRVHEIGVRTALGADRRQILSMVVGEGLRLTAVGLLIGSGVALISTRLVSSFSHLLYGVRESDWLTFVAVSLVLTTMALLACYIPARRATKVDPMVALRFE